jgi:TPR repeat protein
MRSRCACGWQPCLPFFSSVSRPRSLKAMLGLMALRGEGMAKDAVAADAYFKRAEELGYDVEAYLRKIGIERP